MEALDSFEDEFDAEQLIQRLLFIEKIEKGLEDVKAGRVYSFDDVKKRFQDRWEQSQ